MQKEYESLFTPWKIGNVEIKNRIVMTSMGGTSIFGWLEPNHFDEEAANFLLERARDLFERVLPPDRYRESRPREPREQALGLEDEHRGKDCTEIVAERFRRNAFLRHDSYVRRTRP